jgi:cytochrome c biogenesis protein ResB
MRNLFTQKHHSQGLALTALIVTVLFVFFAVTGTSFAQSVSENDHRERLIQQSFLSFTGQSEPVTFISKLSFETNPSAFTNSNGQGVMLNPTMLVSAYDSSITYASGDMYKQRLPRLVGIVNTPGFARGQYISIGFDSGMQSQKLVINPSILLGISQSFQVAKKSLVHVGVGAWIGGNVGESPCVDSYAREYYCGNLTSWNDYKPNHPRNLSFADVRFVQMFDF